MNIFVVEDEPLALDDLLGMLQVFADAHQIVGCASGSEALADAVATPPDLLITDIRMAELDGLELIRRLKGRIPHLAAIVLSGYSEFEYARTGIRLGITDYLLKPVRTDNLHQAVARALAAIAAERRRATQLREAELARLLLGGSHAASSETNLLAGHWGIIVLLCENWESPTVWRDTPIDRRFIEQTIARVTPTACDIIGIQARCRLVLVPLDGPQVHVLEAIAQRLHRAIVSAGIVVHTTYAYKSAGERPERAVPEALNRLARGVQFAAPTFVRPDALSADGSGDVVGEHTLLIARALTEGKLSTALAEVYAALAQLQSESATQHTVVRTLEGLFGLIQHKLLGAASLPGPDAIAAAVRSSRTYDELATWVDVQLQPLFTRQRRAATPRQLVRALIGLVHTSYADNISLQKFAAEHNVSLAYFSRLFKEEVGVTFSDYLTGVRIEKAKALLERRERSPRDVSLLVGYDDPKYFSQLFRKVVGVSPLDYQRSRRRKQRRADGIALENESR